MHVRKIRGILSVVIAAIFFAGCGLQQDIASSNVNSAPNVGQTAPELQGLLLGGGQFNLTAQRGHIVLVDFWASWCTPCRAQQPQLNAMVKKYASKGVMAIGVDERDDNAQAQSYQTDFQVPYPSLTDASADVAGRFDVLAPPTLIVINQKGVIANLYPGGAVEDRVGPVLDTLLRNG